MWLFFHSPTPGSKIFFLDRGGHRKTLGEKLKKNKAGQEVNQGKMLLPPSFIRQRKNARIM